MMTGNKDYDLDGFVGYFGTRGQAGHNLYVLAGGDNLTPLDISDLAAEFDSDAIMRKLSIKSIMLFYYRNLTIIGYPVSLDDKRPGSKSLFIVGGIKTADEVLERMKDFQWVVEIFKEIYISIFRLW